MNKITQKEQAAIYLERARANSERLTDKKLAVILLLGSEFRISTEFEDYTLTKFNGKLYYIYIK
tara:strand:- start:3569 stop:3760 length:192 start_codon:yes stop_codon:yes gene_type:complete